MDATITQSSPAAPVETSPRCIWAAAALIALAAFGAYHNTLTAPFVFDDVASIPDNITLRGVWSALTPPSAGATVSGRPFLNLTLALNHAISGDQVWSYHVLNLVVHVLAGLTLFGIIRRTLLLPVMRAKYGANSYQLSLATACLWVLHPLQTESVTYVVQRAESLMGLLYLLTLYFFIRSLTPTTWSPRWLGFSVFSCLLGMATKEVMVSAPVIVWLYDRTFVSETFLGAWRKRPAYYLGLAGTWMLLALLVLTTGNRSATVGIGAGVSVPHYALTQFRAIAVYLKLCFWPSTLTFDYGTEFVHSFTEVWPQAILVVSLLSLCAVAVWRRSPMGFVGMWFFAVLAPSSSFVPIATQTMTEHRMYLSLCTVPLVLVFCAYAWLGRWAVILCVSLAVLLGWQTWRRNETYRSDIELWRDSVSRRPQNARAHNNLGIALSKQNRWEESAVQFEEAVRLQPKHPDAYNNLGCNLTRLGRYAEAVTVLGEAVRMKPDYAQAHQNLGEALSHLGRFNEAIENYQTALRLHLDLPETHAQLGHALAQIGRAQEAIAACEQTLKLDPGNASAHNDLGIALAQTGRLPEATAQFERVVQLDPNFADARNNFGNMLLLGGQPDLAVAQYRAVLRLQPSHAPAHNNLGEALARTGRAKEAMVEFEAALLIDPTYAAAQRNLERLRTSTR